MDKTSLSFRALELYGTRMHHRGHWKVHSRLRQLLNVNIDRYMEVERAGLRWVLNPFDYVQQSLFWLGEHDRWEVFHIKRLLTPGGVICDIGANFGYYSLTLATSLKPNGHVFAFEPHPEIRNRLERHVALNHLNDFITVIPCALSDAPGNVRMEWREDNTGAAYISEHGSTEVEVATLDTICERRLLSRLDFVKIDVEGFEARVLRGGQQCLRTFQPKLLIEMLPIQLERAGSSAAELASILRGHGYKLYVTDRKRLRPLANLPSGSELVNAFCFPDAN